MVVAAGQHAYLIWLTHAPHVRQPHAARQRLGCPGINGHQLSNDHQAAHDITAKGVQLMLRDAGIPQVVTTFYHTVKARFFL
jgi:hypothetical protein